MAWVFPEPRLKQRVRGFFIALPQIKYMKRKLIILLTLLVLSISAFAQLEVKEGSFKEVPGFVNINSDPIYQTDDNDLQFAIIKVKTENINDKQRRKLLFEGNAGTFVMLEYKTGEVWVYLTARYADYIKISHPDYSSTEFTFPFDLKPKQGYELTLVNMANYKSISEEPDYNYLIVKADQPNAMIYFDDVFMGKDECSKLFKVGEQHKWRIDCDLYHSENGESIIVTGEPIKIEKTLRPAYGYINVTSEPENGAMVYIDNINVGVTPFKSDKITSGQHEVKIIKEMYNEVLQTITVTDGNTCDVKMTMLAKFVNVMVKTNAESDIFIDNVKKCKGKWRGRLSEGQHVFEAKKESHRTSVKSAEIVLGKDVEIIIPDPEPIFGSINANSNPIGATIKIDGSDYGTTPRVIKNILIGNHKVVFEKKGYNSETKQIKVSEGEMIDIDAELSIGKTVTITTNSSGAKIYVDGKEIGVSKITTVLSFGKHSITAKQGNKSAYQVINVSTYDNGCAVNLVLEKETSVSYAQNGYKFIALHIAPCQYGDLSYGLTMGSARKFGWFASLSSSFDLHGYNYDFECDKTFHVNGSYPEYSGKESYTRMSAIVGLMGHIDGPVVMWKFGLGYGMMAKSYATNNGTWVKNTSLSCEGVDVLVGVQGNLRGCVISLDWVATNLKQVEMRLGIGYGRKNK